MICYQASLIVSKLRNFGIFGKQSFLFKSTAVRMHLLTKLSLFGINSDSTLNPCITHEKIKYHSFWIDSNLPNSVSRWAVSSRCMSSAFSSLLFSRFHFILALAHWLPLGSSTWRQEDWLYVLSRHVPFVFSVYTCPKPSAPWNNRNKLGFYKSYSKDGETIFLIIHTFLNHNKLE